MYVMKNADANIAEAVGNVVAEKAIVSKIETTGTTTANNESEARIADAAGSAAAKKVGTLEIHKNALVANTAKNVSESKDNDAAAANMAKAVCNKRESVLG